MTPLKKEANNIMKMIKKALQIMLTKVPYPWHGFPPLVKEGKQVSHKQPFPLLALQYDLIYKNSIYTGLSREMFIVETFGPKIDRSGAVLSKGRMPLFSWLGCGYRGALCSESAESQA